MNKLKIALAQIGPTIGALRTDKNYKGNLELHLDAWVKAKEQGADLVVATEMSLVGYPARDLIQREDLLNAAQTVLTELTEKTKDGPAFLVGAPLYENGQVFNAAYLLDKGRVIGVTRKHHLPNYGEFDDKRNFAEGDFPDVIDWHRVKLGVLICEDTWKQDVALHLAKQRATILISINASPFVKCKHEKRLKDVLEKRVTETGLPIIYVNQMIGIDGLVFDGSSVAMNTDTSLLLQAPSWEEGVYMTEWQETASGLVGRSDILVKPPEGLETLYMALVKGTHDYIVQNGFKKVVLGLSGGIDSSLVAMIAADAIGGENVTCLRLPSQYTADISNDTAETIARHIHALLHTVEIEPIVDVFRKQLSPIRKENAPSVTDENLQARARGVVIMAYSNDYGCLVLTTGNKSEVGTGFCTLYGDMNGGFNPLKDVYKTEVYELVKWRNAHKSKNALGPEGLIVPEEVLTRPPSAELKEDQKDQDSLPPYPILDDILQRFVEKKETIDAIIAAGHDEKTVLRVWKLIDSAEYKRQQAAPGVMVSAGEFDRVYRMPISHRFNSAQLRRKG